MLQQLDDKSQAVGLKMNRSKTKIMTNIQEEERNMMVGNEAIEKVDKYVYLGQEITLEDPEMLVMSEHL